MSLSQGLAKNIVNVVSAMSPSCPAGLPMAKQRFEAIKGTGDASAQFSWRQRVRGHDVAVSAAAGWCAIGR